MKIKPGNAKARKNLWYLLLLFPVIAIAWVPSYNTVEPRLVGFPFFWWYQLLWVGLSAALTWIVYAATAKR